MTEHDALEPKPRDTSPLEALAKLIQQHQHPTPEGREVSQRTWTYTFVRESTEIVHMIAGSDTALSKVFRSDAFAGETPDTFMLVRHPVEDGFGISLVAFYLSGSTQELTVETTPATPEPFRVVNTITDRSKPGDPDGFKIYEFTSDKERREHVAFLRLMLERDLFLAEDRSEG